MVINCSSYLYNIFSCSFSFRVIRVTRQSRQHIRICNKRSCKSRHQLSHRVTSDACGLSLQLTTWPRPPPSWMQLIESAARHKFESEGILNDQSSYWFVSDDTRVSSKPIHNCLTRGLLLLDCGEEFAGRRILRVIRLSSEELFEGISQHKLYSTSSSQLDHRFRAW